MSVSVILSQHINDEMLKPGYNLVYKHLTEYELRWICYKKGISLSSRLTDMKSFICKYPDLKVLEEEINNGSFTWYKTRKFSWYLVDLIFFRRIKVPIGFLYEIRVCSSEIRNFEEEINLLLTGMEKVAINMRGYSREHVQNGFMTETVRIILYYQCSIKEAIFKISTYENLLKENGLIRKQSLYSGLKSILYEMKYDLEGYIDSEYKLKSSEKLFFSNSPEFCEAFDLYLNTLKQNYKFKTAKTEASHLRVFFSFMDSRFPETKLLSQITNEHISEFVKQQKEEINIHGNKNSPGTINHRLECLNKFINHYIGEECYSLAKNNITKYDKLREYKIYPTYMSKNDILKLIEVIKSIDQTEYMQEKNILILLIDTGRRVHEVLTLRYNCFENDKIFFHKLKQGKKHWQKVGPAAISAIISLKESAKNIKTELYSPLDGLKVRRLCPSIKKKGKSIICYDHMTQYFSKLQIENGITDDKGNPKFTLHDNKRGFVANMLAAGVSTQEISKILGQEVESLLPYEVNNQCAIETLGRIEKKGYLGGGCIRDDIIYETEFTNNIAELLSDEEIILRNKRNLLYKIEKEYAVIPLIIGSCMDSDFVTECGNLICLTCKNIWINEGEDMSKVNEFVIKSLKYIYNYKRTQDAKKYEKVFIESIKSFFRETRKLNDDQIKRTLSSYKKLARGELKNEKL